MPFIVFALLLSTIPLGGSFVEESGALVRHATLLKGAQYVVVGILNAVGICIIFDKARLAAFTWMLAVLSIVLLGGALVADAVIGL